MKKYLLLLCYYKNLKLSLLLFIKIKIAKSCLKLLKKYLTVARIRQPPDEDTWNGQILGYKISYGDENESAEVNTKTTLGYERQEIRITNLRPYTTYRIAVKSFNSVGPGPDSEVIRVMTNEGG